MNLGKVLSLWLDNEPWHGTVQALAFLPSNATHKHALMEQIYNPVQEEFKLVNRLIIDKLYSNVPLVENIGHYIVKAGGKRLRPLLALLSANSCDYKGQWHIQLAAVIELLHTATLLHDDVVDDSSLRRGRLTANAQWSNASSILVGDFIYTRAFQMMVEMGDMRVLELLSYTSNILSEGEVFQLTKEGDASTTEQEYMQIIQNKTAELFAAACQGGAILAGAGQPMEEEFRTYGLQLGIAFQLVDDVLDYSGDPETMGKSIGDDLAEGKPTLPLIYTMKNGTAAQVALVKEAIETKSSARIEEVIQAVKTCGALQYTQQRANYYSDLASQAIQSLSASIYKESMLALAEFSVSRAAWTPSNEAKKLSSSLTYDPNHDLANLHIASVRSEIQVSWLYKPIFNFTSGYK